MATLTITKNNVVVASVDVKKGGSFSLDNAMIGRRIANRLRNTDEDFANLTYNSDYTIADAMEDLRLLVSVCARMFDSEIYMISDTMSSWSLSRELEGILRQMRERRVYVRRGARSHYWYVSISRNHNDVMVASFHNGVYYAATEEVFRAIAENPGFEYEDNPTVCPYTGETDAEKLHWLPRLSRYAFGNCWVAEKWIRSREGLAVCEQCGAVHPANDLCSVYDYRTGESRAVCYNCRDRAVWCYIHQRYEIGTDFEQVNGRCMCAEAYAEESAAGRVVDCPHCGAHVHTDDLRTVVDEDNESVDCCGCCSWQIRQGIQWQRQRGRLAYSEKPHSRFYGVDGKSKTPKEDLYIGFELELDQEHRTWGGRSDLDANKYASIIMKEWNGEFYVKNDGSLTDGAETVSMPHTIGAIYATDWEKLLGYAEEYDLQANNTCGLHTHISVTAFGKNKTERNLNTAKLAVLINRNYDWFAKVARRRAGDISHWAAKYESRCVPANVERFKELGANEIVTRCYYDGRYHAVNVRNSATVELRLWAASTDEDTLTGTMDFAQALVRMVCASSVEDMYTFTPKDIMEKCVPYAHDAANVNALFDNTGARE